MKEYVRICEKYEINKFSLTMQIFLSGQKYVALGLRRVKHRVKRGVCRHIYLFPYIMALGLEKIPSLPPIQALGLRKTPSLQHSQLSAHIDSGPLYSLRDLEKFRTGSGT